MVEVLRETVSTRPATLAAARDYLVSTFAPVVGRERVPLDAGLGRCLADAVVAPADLPRCDVAAMDGYAVRAGDLDPAGRTRLAVVGEVAAGHAPTVRIGRGEAARIYTGAMLPAGAERVIVQELCVEVDGDVIVSPPKGPKPNVRQRGEDVRTGQVVLSAGQRIGAGQLALLQALQIPEVSVHRRLRVALVSVGDELKEGPARLGPAQIVDSNRPMLRAMLDAAGCEVSDLGILPDDADRVVAVLIVAAQENDLIVSSGGASGGATDHLRRLISQRGCLEFWRLGMRPGKPVGFGDIDDCPILALPGNPMAAAVAFTLLGRPLIARLGGDPAADPGQFVLPLASPIEKVAGRTEVLAARLERCRGATTVAPLPIQGSASLTALAGAEGLIVLPPEATRLAAGTQVGFTPF